MKPGALAGALGVGKPKAPRPDPPTVCPTCGTCSWGDDVIGAARAYLASVAVKGVGRNGGPRAMVCLKILDGPQNLSNEALLAEVRRRAPKADAP